MDTFVIGFTGKAGSGKDTAANYLKKNYNFRSVAFADPLRDMLVASGAVTMNQLTDRTLKEQVIEKFGKAPRNMAQTLGTEWARQLVHPDFWLILAGDTIDEYQNDGYNVVVTDVRFENEAEFIRKRGGLVVHIVRDSAGTAHVHASEAGVAIKPEDQLIFNNSTIENMNRQLEQLMHVRSLAGY